MRIILLSYLLCPAHAARSDRRGPDWRVYMLLENSVSIWVHYRLLVGRVSYKINTARAEIAESHPNTKLLLEKNY